MRSKAATAASILCSTALLLTAGCASMRSDREPQVVNGKQWTRAMENKRQSLGPLTAGTGIKITRTADNQLKLDVPGDFSFDPGKSELKARMVPVLEAVARNIDPDVRITVIGHADSAGNAAPNELLSLDRAEAVREALVRAGVSRKRLAVEGAAARTPAAGGNLTTADRAQGRRVEILLSEPAAGSAS